jgi:hypothetical protein
MGHTLDGISSGGGWQRAEAASRKTEDTGSKTKESALGEEGGRKECKSQKQR